MSDYRHDPDEPYDPSVEGDDLPMEYDEFGRPMRCDGCWMPVDECECGDDFADDDG